MPDTIDPSAGGPYISGLETRVSTLEGDVRDLRDTLSDLKTGTARIEAMLSATLPHLATKSAMEASIGRMEAMLTASLPRLATKSAMQASIGGMEAMLAATLPHLATNAELAEKPSKTYLWGILGVLVAAILGAFAATLAAVSILH